MISTQHEIETLINEKFMQKIQPTTITYEIQKPDIYDNNTDEYVIDEIRPVQNVYNYLHDETLHKVIDPTPDTEYHYVLYNVMDVTTKPFVKFLMYNLNNMMKFPNEKANIENNDISDTESETSDILPYDDIDNDETIDELDIYSNNTENMDDNYINEQCSRYIEKKFGIDYVKSNDNYKGHVKVDDKFYIFIDVSAIELIFPENEVFSWVIIDEIINKKMSNNVPICNIVINMFSINKPIKNIYDENNDIIEYPICVYLCKKESEENYISVESKPSTNMSLVSDKLEHPIFGNTTLFSTERLNIDDKKLERYCLFTADSIYVLHSNFTKYEIGLINNKSCIRFLQKTKEYWSVKNSILYLGI